MANNGHLLHPEVLWAQRTNEIYFTISLIDIKDVKLNVTKDTIQFEGVGGTEQKRYGFDLQLYDEIKPESSKRSDTERGIFLVLDKAKSEQPYWPSLQKGRKLPFVRTDFSRWKDEDEDEGEDVGAGMDFSSLMGNASDADSDDSDDVPDLEAADPDREASEADKEGDTTASKGEPEKTADSETKEA